MATLLKSSAPLYLRGNCKWLGLLTSNKIQSSEYSTHGLPVRKSLKSLDVTQIKKGTGGRSSFSGIIATVFGSTGFLGRYVINRLGRIGSQIILPYRGDEYETLRLKMSGDLGQILFHPFDLRNEESLYKVMRYSNVVINTIGKDYETSNWKFSDTHINGPRNIARIAKECGVEKFIHVSALNCDENPTPIILKKGSQFLRSKWYGEEAIKDEFPTATIIRPSDMFGMEDTFLRQYCHVARFSGLGGIVTPTLPLWNKGKNVIKQPVYVDDVAQGIINCLFDEDAIGQIYEAAGPKRYELVELVNYIYRYLRLQNIFSIRNMKYDLAFRLRVSLAEKFLKYSYISWEKMEREHMTDVLTGKPGLEDLGVTLTNLEDKAQFILRMFLRRGLLPFDEIEPPAIANC